MNVFALETEVSNINITTAAAVLMGAVALLMLLTVTIYRSMVMRPAGNRRHKSADNGLEMPDISVIVLARDDPERVSAMLPLLLDQDYRGNYEVIIVNDGERDAMNSVIETFRSGRQCGLKFTFVPGEAYNLSRRKLAITLGAKASGYPYIIILDTSCRISSRGWLKAFGSRFAAGHDVVLGHKAFPEKSGCLITADNLIENVTWMSAAIGGHPYRGCGVNIGYRRQLFFDNKGFARSLNLNGGDDDIFINEIASGDNCTVALSDDSVVYDESAAPHVKWREERHVHGFTGRRLPKRFRRYLRCMTAMLWVSVGLSIAVGLLTWPQWWPAVTVGSMTLIQWVVAVWCWKRAALALHYNISVGSLIIGLAASPVYTAKEWIRAHRNTDRNYTWYS